MRSIPRLALAASALLVTALPAAGPADSPRQVTFEERVAAQRAIEQVYYSNQVGATRPFDEAVPQEVLEEKVRTYLKQSVALEKFWRTPVTAEALRRELERIAGNTQFPDRLREIYVALGNDPVLVQECLARPVLVERLAKNFFAYDERIHGETRAQAERLRQRLVEGRLPIDAAPPQGQMMDIVRTTDGELGPTDPVPGVIELPSLQFERALAQLGGVGEIGRVEEERGAFTISTVLAEGADRARVARHSVKKATWEEWWNTAEGSFPERSARTVAAGGPLPSPSGPSTTSSAPARLSGTAAVEREACAPEDGWDDGLRYDVPGERYEHQAVFTGSLVILWGGNQAYDDYSYHTNTGARYDPATDTWASMSTVGAPGDGLAVWTGREMVVIPSDQPAAKYNPITDTWKPVSSSGAPRSSGASAVWTGTEIIIWGGRVLSCVQDRCRYDLVNTGARYDPVMDTWTPTATMGAPSGRAEHAAVWTGKEMIVWGGGHQSGGRYDPRTDSWETISLSGSPLPAKWNRALWTGQEAFIWGPSPECVGPVSAARYDPIRDMWVKVSAAGAPALYECDPEPAVWTGAEVIVWGTADSRAYDPTTDTWRPVGGGSGFSPVWTGTEVIVWGGTSGERYDPVTDSWTPMSGGQARPPFPLQTGGQSTVWTGTLLMVIGGYHSPSGDYGGGAAYDPLTDSWVEGPSYGRSSPRVVWTGDYVIIWGGHSKGGADWQTGRQFDPVRKRWREMNFPGDEDNPGPILAGSVVLFGRNNGDHLRYDPRTETWSPVSTVGAPQRLTGLTVWTGREALFWNPPSPSSPGSGSGSRYDPATDSWASLSIVGSPPLGAGSSAVWADRQMIVWGSREDVGRVASDGARYDPLTDAWSPMSQQGAPSARSRHSAVWTGEEMVIWGGVEPWQGGTALNTGGRYDPMADSWLPTTTRNAPPPFITHEAFWAGPAMLIWGGRALAAGGQYYPSIRRDLDADGFTACEGDCDDAEAAVSPAGIDLPGNYLDENCDGTASCDPRAARNRGQLVSCVERECGALVRSGAIEAAACNEALSKSRRRAACGDGVVEGVEVCDRASVVGRTCQAWGFEGGELRCSDRCDGFDLSACVGCGDGVRRFPEQCDGDDLGGQTCQDFGGTGGTLRCDELCGFDLSGCASVPPVP